MIISRDKMTNIKDWWEKQPTWIKGGLVSIVIFLLLSILFVVTRIWLQHYVPNFLNSLFEIILLLYLPAAIIVQYFNNVSSLENLFLRDCNFSGLCETGLDIVFIIVISLIFYFFIGALIGWVIGKKKSKKWKK